jgi:hypothetical protein
MRATLVMHIKEVKGDEIVEIRIWRVPKNPRTPDGVKISIVYVKNGRRLIGYDNGEGKGYHKHIKGKEYQYEFSDIWALLRDFKKDLKAARGRDWDED